jgi:uncharacterized protein with HEPN domain
MRGDRAYAADIFNEARFLRSVCERVTFEQFVGDPVLRRAVERSFTIIGEATKNLSAEFCRQYEELPWSWMARKRDLLAHHYHQVNYRIIWRTMQDDIPVLIRVLAPIVSPPDSESEMFK